MTSTTSSHAGAPFAHMLRSAVLPSALVGLVPVVLFAVTDGVKGAWSAGLGWAVALLFFASGMFLMSRLVRSASPHAFFAVAMTVIGLLLFLIAFHGRDWIHGKALGVAALVVTIVWQVFAMRAMRTARIPVYDESAIRPGEGS